MRPRGSESHRLERELPGLLVHTQQAADNGKNSQVKSLCTYEQHLDRSEAHRNSVRVSPPLLSSSSRMGVHRRGLHPVPRACPHVNGQHQEHTAHQRRADVGGTWGQMK